MIILQVTAGSELLAITVQREFSGFASEEQNLVLFTRIGTKSINAVGTTRHHRMVYITVKELRYWIYLVYQA